MKAVLLGIILTLFTGCTTTENILAGATHACGQVHVEGYWTDTQGDVVVAKAPDNWTPEQVQAFCNP